MKRKFRRRLILAFMLLIAAGAGFLYALLWVPNRFSEDRVIIVSKGQSFHSVVSSLEDAGILRSRWSFVTAGRILGLTTKMQIGKYRFHSGMTNKDILEDLQSGESTELISVTIPEGLRATRHAQIFAKRLGIDSSRFMELVYDDDLIADLGVKAKNLEGYLLPNTYTFYWQTDEGDILRQMIAACLNEFTDSIRASLERNDRTIGEVLTLASIVESETSIDSERPLVAGVYVNRLKKRMRLEADPTIQYILPDGPRRLYFSDLKVESEYNTYLRYGLPPGPINNPGVASIRSAIAPATNNYLFFVADGKGGHTFTRTFDEHRKAIKQLRRVRDFRELVRQEG